ncbi:MAG TPA: amidase [Povalibacter sp.]|uniref:amidase n=1 Tax=Povalibacter sp. TaxID=1962978 RepID=UPI002D162E64|nr:amidase [Povalibacter sp.]HMN43694.1 amidase [Povalibacter sp.]
MSITRRQFTLLAAGTVATQFLSQRGLAAAAASDPTQLTLAEAAARIRAGSLSAVELTEVTLSRIATYNPKLDAFITVMKNQALAQARQLDAEQKAGKLRGPLHGVPIAIKDIIDTADARTTGGSALFEDRVPDEDATVVARLRAAGAVIVGKTNTQEFAMGGGETSFWGPARNPWNLAHNTGGSSSGSGAAVAAFLSHGALGTDTGGSVRMPASFCGIVGLKPTYGLVPIKGIMPLTLSLDHCGPMTRTVEDTALMLNAMAGYDQLDITSVPHEKEDYVAQLAQPVSGFRLGKPISYFDGVDPEVEAAVEKAIDLLATLTKGVADVNLPGVTHLGSLGTLGETLAWHEEYFKNAPGKYMLAERRRLASIAEAEPKAVDYIRARWEVELLRRKVDSAFKDFDLVVLPTQRIVAPTLDELLARAAESAPANPRVVSNCQPFNVMGLPAVSIPCGFSRSGLPIGLMIAGPTFSEGKVLALAQAYEKATDWHLRKPPLTSTTPVPEVGKSLNIRWNR